MSLRIISSIFFIYIYFDRKISIVLNFLPSYKTLIAFLISGIVCWTSSRSFERGTMKHRLIHISIGITCFLVICFTLLKLDKNFISEIKQIRKEKMELNKQTQTQTQKKNK
eukprot:c17246_g1_i1.p1 GENE.c17246_g1_i1~~c17246_g1_i1.p1  ORF type:complete len:111 (+),score=4.43 c17246_g1_i1:3-335(+)